MGASDRTLRYSVAANGDSSGWSGVGIEFRVGERPQKPGFRLSSCRSLSDVHARLTAVLGEAGQGEILDLYFDPPSVPTLSIPLAFKVLIGLIEDPGRESQRPSLVHVDSEAVLDHLYRYLPAPADGEAATVGRLRLRFCVRDLLAIRADAIVNASNSSLKLGGGVSGAIRDAAHPALQAELARLASRTVLGPGEAVMTDAFGLQNCRRIVHAVTMGGRVEEVRAAIRNALELCDHEHLASLAVPALGTGTGGMSVEDFTDALRAGVLDHLARHPEGSVLEMVVALWTRTDFNLAYAKWRALDSASASSGPRTG